MLVEHLWIGGYTQRGQGTIEPADLTNVTGEGDHLSQLTDLRGFLNGSSLVHEISVHVDGVGIEPSNMLAIRDATEHVIVFIPHERVYHVLDLHDFGLVYLG